MAAATRAVFGKLDKNEFLENDVMPPNIIGPQAHTCKNASEKLDARNPPGQCLIVDGGWND